VVVQGDAAMLRRTMELARADHPHPNPRVGAVVVDQSGEIVGEGSHAGPGAPHAEVVALQQAGGRARGATLFVSLEPCSHYGLTPPCVSAISSAGVTRVVAGAIDPDTRVSGSGLAWLEDAGIETTLGVDGVDVEAIDPGYFHHRRTGLPRVILKWAMTLDGSIAAADGSSRWVSSEEARLDAHRLRRDADAVVIGAGTLRADDPQLTARGDSDNDRQPIPVIIAGKTPLSFESRIWDREPIVISAREIEIVSGVLIVVDGEDDLPDPRAAAMALGEAGLLDLLLEGGARLAGAWWRSGLISRGVVYVAGRVGGGAGLSPLGGEFASMASSVEVSIVDVTRLGPDLRLEFE
jgi:diaminohydroxyphosphoribosylaminopyrimidine deaminase / 5-amino-6-(5-phosphoribosylamino)uracil reductase